MVLSQWNGSQPRQVRHMHQRCRCYASLRSVDVAGCSVSLSDHIKILGITLDSHFSLHRHISSICKSAYYHLRSLRHICSAITDDMAKLVACAIVCFCLDYANSLLFTAAHVHLTFSSTSLLFYRSLNILCNMHNSQID